MIGLPVCYGLSISIGFAQGHATGHLLGFKSSSLFGRTDQNIDLSHFSIANYIMPGKYLVNLSVNGQSIGLREVGFEQLDQTESAVLCVSEGVLKALDLDSNRLNRLPKKHCLDIKDISSDAFYSFDLSELALQISVPLDVQVNRPRGYISPDRFDAGVAAAFIRYDYNAYYEHRRNTQYGSTKDHRSQYLSLDGGANLSEWSFRHRGSFSSNGADLSRYRSNQNEFSTDILKLRSQLSLGEFSTNSCYINSLPILGIQLKSDEQMLPMSQRSYAPIIDSFADSNALVDVYQNGQKIYERTVPAGAFQITDLTVNSTRGDLTVEITEAGGDKRSFIVPLKSNINLVRAGIFNYNLALGKYTFYDRPAEDWIGQGSFEYGLNNNMSLYVGSNQSHPYQGYLVGLGINTRLGGINIDVENSQTSLRGNDNNGQRYQLGYQYAFQPSNIQLSLNTKHQTRDYMTVNNAMSLFNFAALNQDEHANFNRTFLIKNQHSMTFNQSFNNADLGSINASVMQYEYWNDSKKYNQFTLGYNNRWNAVAYSFGVSRNEYKEENSNQIYLSLSIPLDFKQQRFFLNSNFQYNDQQNASTTASASVSGSLGENNQTLFGVSAGQTKTSNNNARAISVNLSHRLPQIQLGATASGNDAHLQYSYAVKGAVVAHPYGLTWVNELSDTYTIIHVDDGYGATVDNAWGVSIDRFGNAIYPYSIPYQVNQIAIDPAALALNVNLKENKQEVIPRKNSATLVEFKAQTSSLILLAIQNAEQRFVMGSPVVNARGETIGNISQANEVIVENDRLLTQQLRVNWGETADDTCRIQLSDQQMDLTRLSQQAFNIIEVECK